MSSLTTAQLRQIFKEPNVRAFARVIREGESNQTERAYHLRYNGPHLAAVLVEDLTEHPRVMVDTGKGTQSSAAGAYQFTWSTWRDEILANWPDLTFCPDDQDAAYVGLLSLTGHALDYVRSGMFDQAVNACRGRWTSLPGAAENNPRYDWGRARSVYEAYDGEFRGPAAKPEPAPPVVPIEVPEPVAPVPKPPRPPMEVPHMGLLAALLPSVLALFTPRATAQLQKITGASPEIVQAFTTDLFTKIGQATGTPAPLENPIAAVAALQKAKTEAPEVVEQVESSALEALDKLLPVIDKLAAHDKARWEADRESADAAGARGQKDRFDIGPRLAQTGDWIFGVAFIVSLIIMAGQMWYSPDHKPDALLSSILTLFVYAAARAFETPRRYRFGGPSESAATDVAVQAAGRVLDAEDLKLKQSRAR